MDVFTISVAVTEAEARELQTRFRGQNAHLMPETFEGRLLKKIEAKLPTRYAPCIEPGCYTRWTELDLFANHLADDHNYEDDPYGEDTAQSNAWIALSRVGLTPPRL